MFSASSSLQQQQPQRINTSQLNDLNNRHHQNSTQARVNITPINNVFSNNVKISRQLQSDNQHGTKQEDGFNKTSLDDKIKHLLISKDDEQAQICSNGNNSIAVRGSGNSGVLDNNLIYQQSSINGSSNNGSVLFRAAQEPLTKHQQQPEISLDKLSNKTLSVKHDSGANNEVFNNGQKSQFALHKSPSSGQLANIHNANQHKFYNTDADNHLQTSTNRIYLNESIQKMGNRQQGQYNLKINNNQLESPTRFQQVVAGVGESSRKNEIANSHLIVDLTTPRVLAKTQTTLLPATTNQSEVNHSTTWSLNQVGLPQPLTRSNATNLSKQNSTLAFSESSSISKQDSQADSQILERSAPYYYSDLKSEEQRKALLSIVQQKSLSPPPQLLSRSTDQSNTRLALKSATLHPQHARMLSENLAKQHQRLNRNDKSKYASVNDFSSASRNISKNIDKLFDSPIQSNITEQKLNGVQSMLVLNDSTDSSHLSSFQTNSESISSGYCSSELRNKNFSKSKSLENISQRSLDDRLDELHKLNGSPNPVYENICRSDRLISAMNNSTTCLSTTSASRLGQRRASNFVDNNDNKLDSSMDSILGSSLDDASDSSLDMIDQIKITPNENSLTDINQLIEQLKSNHSKLTEEYKSTLIRISNTINTRNRQEKSEKSAKRLQLLELKSKKCESRSRKQLDLIHMLEKLLQKHSNNKKPVQDNLQDKQLVLVSENCILSSINSSEPSASRDQLCSSPCLSFDYRQEDVKQGTSGDGGNNIVKTTQRQNQASQNGSSTTTTTSGQSSSSERPNVIKAIVTEAKSAGKLEMTEVKESSELSRLVNGAQVSLSTRHQLNLQSGSNKLLSKKTSRTVDQKICDIESRNDKTTGRNNPFSDHSDGGCNSSVNNGLGKESSSSVTNGWDKMQTKQGGIIMNNDFMRDDEDFIEFLTNDGSSYRSKFDASQFSASDFNTSTSASESSTSGPCNDSLNSTPVISSPSRHLFTNGTNTTTTTTATTTTVTTTTTGILKNKNGSKNNGNNGKDVKRSGNSGNNNNNNIDASEISEEKNSRFNNVLGNVIDVDVCPINSLSQCSPVNNRA